MVRVSAPARVHMTLIDLNGSLGRVDGGIGLALRSPRMVVEVERGRGLSAEGELAERALAAARHVLEAYSLPGAEIRVLTAYPQHVGLGSGTQLSLAVARGICEAYGIEAGVRELAQLVGRGGTSGIGVAAFEGGGFILDGGHSKREKPEFLPSSASRAKPAPLVLRRDFPDWEVALVLPEPERRIFSTREVSIFQRFCPIPISQVERLSHVILMKLLPALAEEDITGFGEAVNLIQKTGFKEIELMLQAPNVRELLALCQRLSYGAGLSSFGPVIYALPRDPEEFVRILRSRRDVRSVWLTRADNRGARVE
ncbi:MAG: beta-ribofuranosylaminobenzene 5'-phosphate synthase [Euryarchaeota archaeon]|nr:beta-ribofuranosylaminobenzene 5'-phosphate synthase [Euryarchaeota archaeon]